MDRSQRSTTDRNDSHSDPIDWSSVPADPDLHADFGYELVELDIIEPDAGCGELIALPHEEEMHGEDAFIMATPSAVCDPVENA